jgi:hypothetical protein
MNNLLQSALVVASVAVLWRSTLKKKPHLAEKIQEKFPFFLGTAITCGLCFTFWTAFFFVLIFNPFSFFELNHFLGVAGILAHFFLSWMLVGVLALVIRFAYAILEETVDLLSKKNGHAHTHK